MRVALGQINPTVGDLEGNSDRIVEAARRARDGGADLVVFPELALNGYPPRDLVEIPSFLERTGEALEALAGRIGEVGIAAIVGYVGRPLAALEAGEDERPQRAANLAALLKGGEIAFVQQKMLLPNYDVFDEWRHFAPAERQRPYEFGGQRLGVTICEDVWNDEDFWPRPRYRRDPVRELTEQGIDLIVNISSSPYRQGKRELREQMLSVAAKRSRTSIVMVNQVGGNDQLVFDGSSFVVDRDGQVVARAASFAEDLVFCDITNDLSDLGERDDDEATAVYDALVLGVRDYLRKCGFREAVIGLSGGIDSSITAAIAVDALGGENVLGVAMPGPYSSKGSVTDARALAEALKIRFEVVEIGRAYEAVLANLAPLFGDRAENVAEENVQARLRGLNLMALANKFGSIVLTTGNKSELAVGYCTLYGDMAGGLAVISDVPKTLVYELSRVANRRCPGAIPESVFTKPPSAELRPDQKDSDSLPPYEVLDPLLKLYIEERAGPREIAVELGESIELVEEICRKVDRNEYKRQQAAPGLRVTSKAFGMGRRLPIAQRFQR